VSANNEIEAGQWWVSTKRSDHHLVVNGRVEHGHADDWDVTLLPSGARIMKTTDSIIRDYQPAPPP
jgi:hypothetical protein